MREQDLAERLITYETSGLEGIQSAAGFVKGWLEARDVGVTGGVHDGRPYLVGSVGATDGPTVVLHGHLDVVPAPAAQFAPRLEGDRLIGRGAYDMKGGLAAMMCALRDLSAQRAVRVLLACVADEELETDRLRASDFLVAEGLGADFAVTGEPTNLLIGVQAKGVLAMRLEVGGRAAHGSTPWLGDNAVVKAIEVFRRIQELPFASESSDLFDRPSINLGRISGGDALNKVPDSCVIDVDVRYLPGQDPERILADVRALADVSASVIFHRVPAIVERENPFVTCLAEVVADGSPTDRISVGRHGASDAVSFLEAGIPAVEFGPEGGGHHGPDEWVSVSSLERYKAALVDFVHLLPERLGTRGDLRVA